VVAVEKTAILWIDGPSEGAWNMALDQAMIQHAADENCIILRLYQWARPTLSLGYFQSFEDRSRTPAFESMDCVRRVTGGGAIVHDQEITYSIAVPKSFEELINDDLPTFDSWNENAKSSVNRSHLRHSESLYRTIHSRVTNWLIELGFEARLHKSNSCIDTSVDECKAFLCFERRSDVDIVVTGQGNQSQKVMGSAQRRTSKGLLQHGSLILNPSPFAPHLLGLEQLPPNNPNESKLDEPLKINAKKWGWAIDFCRILQDSVDVLWKCDWKYEDPASNVLERARQIRESRFRNDAWTVHRVRIGDN